MDKKLQLVQAFGTNKSKKKVTSMMSNMIDETGITTVANRGVRDSRLTERAQLIAEDIEVVKQDMINLKEKRSSKYSRDRLLPREVIDEISYKLTYEGLKSQDEERLRTLIHSPHVRYLLEEFFMTRFEHLSSKDEKKFVLRAFIYLDCLVAFCRMSPEINYSAEDLASKFNINSLVVEHLLENFAQPSVIMSGADSKQSQ
jgi:hypothetical protein